MTAARPPSVPCVSLTGQRPGVVNHEQIGHSQRAARRTQGGDAAIKAISARLAGQTKAQLMGRAGQALLWHHAAALQGAAQGRAHVEPVCSRESTECAGFTAWALGYVPPPPPRRTVCRWDSHFTCRTVERSLFPPTFFRLGRPCPRVPVAAAFVEQTLDRDTSICLPASPSPRASVYGPMQRGYQP